jgi:hypothetical protein
MIYIGVHKTKNINDKYMGSGTKIREDIKFLGLEKFEKIILFDFDNEKDMLSKERELVNEEFIKKENNYNIILGGGFYTSDTVTVKNEKNECFRVHKEDPRYLSGELKFNLSGHVAVKKDGQTFSVKTNDPRYLSGELKSINYGTVIVKDKNGNNFRVNTNDCKYLSGEYVAVCKGLVLVKDKNSNCLMVHKEDPRYLSGELLHFWTNKKHKEESKKKIGEKNSLNQKGEKNSNFGKCWIYSLAEKRSISIKKQELENYLKLGWVKGRKQIFS